MKLIWTKSNLPLSVVIRGVTGEDCSHFAFVFESSPAGLMFESNLLGSHPVFFQSSLKGFGAMTIVHELPVPGTLAQENAFWDDLVKYLDDKPYDYTGAVYTGAMVLRERVFKVAIPPTNPWRTNGTYYCDELYQIVQKHYPHLRPVKVVGTCVTPHALWEAVSAS